LSRFDSQERGWIDEATLDQQLDLIKPRRLNRTPTLETGTREPSANVRSALQSAQSLLTTLPNRLGWPVHTVRVRMVPLPKVLKLVW
jgi:hypothetical protein